MLKESLDLTGRRSLVTGASSGIGAEVARELARQGSAVALSGRDAKRLAAVASEIEAEGGATVTIAAELTEDGAPQRIVDAAVSGLGGLDVLVPSAGIFKPQPLLETTAEDLDRVWAVNVRAPFLLAQAAVPQLSKGGAIVFISSISGHVGFASDSAYAATKAAIDGMTRALSVELAASGIRVNAVAPGFTETAMNAGFRENKEMVAKAVSATPAGRLGLVSDIAASVVFLASHAADYTHGVILPVDGNYPTSAIQQGLA